MKYVPSQVVVALKRMLVLLGVYFVLRLAFYFYNFSSFSRYSISEVSFAFLHGFRFDISALLMLNLIFILIWFLPLKWQSGWVQHLTFVLFVCLNGLFIAANVADLELYNFTGKRLTFDFFALSTDWAQQSWQLVFYYAGLLVFLLVLIGALVKLYAPMMGTDGPSLKGAIWAQPLLFILVLIGIVVGVRGGLQLKPLKTAHAYVQGSGDLGLLTLNSSFTLLRSRAGAKLERIHFFNDPVDIQRILQPASGHANSERRTDNVVIIIMESFALEYVGAANHGRGYTPFLDSLIAKSVFFPQAFANGRRSIEALPSILAGIPSLSSEPLITSSFQANEILGLGEVLKEYGYSTSFFHGGENGTMFFDSFSSQLGFDQYYGLDEYPHPQRDFDGSWGVFDEPFFQFTLEKLNDFKTPFVSVVFSLSSHQPYSVPENYKGRFPKGELEIHESIGYADYALKQFFQGASTQPWFNNTLFVITADHTQKSIDPKYQDMLGPYRVPLIFYHPQNKLPTIDTTKVAQHADIMPTVLDWLGIASASSNWFGNSLFSEHHKGFAYNRLPDGYWAIGPRYAIRQLADGKLMAFSHEQTFEFSEVSLGEAEPMGTRWRSYLQYYTNGMLDNSWYRWAESGQ